MTTTQSSAASASRMRATVGQRVHRIRALDEHRPEAIGMVGQDLVGDHGARDQAGDDAMPADRAATITAALPTAPQAREPGVDVHPTLLREVARDQVDQLLEVRVQRAVRRLLDAQVFVDGHTGRRGDATSDGAHIRLRHTGDRARLCDRHLREVGAQLVETVGVLSQPVTVEQRLLDQHTEQRGKTPSVRARTYLQVDVGHLRGLAASRIDHDQRPRRDR